MFFYRTLNRDDTIARVLAERLTNNSFPNIGTTCMNDAPLASDKLSSYKCGDGDKKFYEPPDSTEYNTFAKCSECFSKALQVMLEY